jgi:DNA-binding response OmpR family regulator
MKILIADDVAAIRDLLAGLLKLWGYEVMTAVDGEEALRILRAEDAPQLAIIDWMMPKIEGIELCSRLRETRKNRSQYLIILTARDSKPDVAAALQAGADDYITKPFSDIELKARLQAGERIIRLQNELSDRLEQIEQSTRRINMLEGLLPICAYCKRIRDEQTTPGEERWQEVENYISERSGALFTHGICPSCLHQIMEKQGEAGAK